MFLPAVKYCLSRLLYRLYFLMLMLALFLSAAHSELNKPAIGTIHTLKDTLSDGTYGPDLAVIPAGSLVMGSSVNEAGRLNNERQHIVYIEQPFAISKYEITFAEYERFANKTKRKVPDDIGWGRGQRPIINVSWYDAIAYTEWLSQQTGQKYRLPTEAEWEYTARAGTQTARYWGNEPEKACRYANVHDLTSKLENQFSWLHHNCIDGFARTAPVGSFEANQLGVHDILGNVWEWTCSNYDNNYNGGEKECTTADGITRYVLVRGGAWQVKPRYVRSANRFRIRPSKRHHTIGFRVVREISEKSMRKFTQDELVKEDKNVSNN